MSPRTIVALFTRDLRVHDNPALAAACERADHVVPLFVLDPQVKAGANRWRFLAESLTCLQDSLQERGGDLVVRRGDPVEETIRLARSVGAAGIAAAADYSAYAHRRQRRLAAAGAEERIPLALFPGVTVVPPGQLCPTSGGDHYRVFTPYWRAWRGVRWRDEAPTPTRVALPPGLRGADDPAALIGAGFGRGSPAVVPGGEAAGQERLKAWFPEADRYAERHNDLAGDATSRLGPYLHFGCLSPRSVAATFGGADDFVRQLCWRDFYHQVLNAFPALPTTP